MRRALLPCLAAVFALCALPVGAHASSGQLSMFQDDDQLEFSPPATVASNLDLLKSLGVDQVRVSVFWKAVAPDPSKQAKPSGFDGSDPDAYPKGAWDRYDTLVQLAQARGIAVLFDVTGPAPMWATGNPQRTDIDETYTPDPGEFAAFVRAVGTRYSGSFVPHPKSTATAPPPSSSPGVPGIPPLPGQQQPRARAADDPPSAPLPRVSQWEIWNEPNQPGWLTPQWLPSADGKTQLPVSPVLYRGLADAMYSALQATGHGNDTILVGATAPKGLNVTGPTRAIKPGPFIRELYCVDSHLQVYTGQAAQARGCPTSDPVRAFPAQHPVLFHMTGWSHHPYELTFAPNRRPTDRDYFTMASLSKLSDLMRRVYQRYGQAQPKRGLPLYLTEFGYQTNPPDPLGVSPGKQASYLDQAEYMAWRNSRVKALSQFLLVDGGDPVGLTFQSGLEWINGKRKPSFRAYQLPIWLPKSSGRKHAKLLVWGLVRPAVNGTRPAVQIQFRRRHSKRWHTLATRHGSKGRGYVASHVRLPGTGSIRLNWNGLVSRSVPVHVKRRR